MVNMNKIKTSKDIFDNSRPNIEDLSSITDSYFMKSKSIVSKFGDTEVTYAIFMRRPVLSALNPALKWLDNILKERNCKINIKRFFDEGEYVGAGEPLVYILSLIHISEPTRPY